MATRTTRARRSATTLDARPAVARSSAETEESLAALVGEIVDLDLAGLRLCWRNHLGGTSPAHLPKWLLARLVAYRVQAAALGDLDPATVRRIRRSSSDGDPDPGSAFTPRVAATRDGTELRPGALLLREWKGRMERVMILEDGFAWNGETYSSLSQVAKAITRVNWNGHRFFGLRSARQARRAQ
jgi:Protein of unknown function (DUF2924)